MKSHWISPLKALQGRLKNHSQSVAFGYLRLGSRIFDHFQTMTWQEAWDHCQKYRRYFELLGLKAGDRISIQGYNGVEWVLLDWAALLSGIVTVPLYKASAEEEVKFILQETECKVLFCDEISKNLEIKQILFSSLEDECVRMSSSSIPAADVDPTQLATIIYTSGTQGRPKGVMHTYGNLSGALEVVGKVATISEKDRLFSYLPLSHVAERVLVDMGCLFNGASVYFLDRVEKLIQYLPQAQPTIFMAVPRVWDTLRFRLEKEISNSPFKNWKWLLKLAVKRKLGLHRVRYFVSGAAKLGYETQTALSAYGIDIMEAYGLTETLGASTLTHPDQIVVGSCGKFYPGVEAKIAEDNEILIRAFFHFKGYFKQDDLTAEVVTDGWFATGDIGYIDADGNLFITDRKKNLFKTSSGKYVAPLVAETFLKNHPAVKEAMVIGENRAHCVALAAVDWDIAKVEDLEKHLERVNHKLPHHEQIKTLGLVLDAWTVNSGELTPSFKLKRKVILEKYAREIEGLYQARSRVVVEEREGQRKRAHSSF